MASKPLYDVKALVLGFYKSKRGLSRLSAYSVEHVKAELNIPDITSDEIKVAIRGWVSLGVLHDVENSGTHFYYNVLHQANV